MNYYNNKAQDYFDETVVFDMSVTLTSFVRYLQKNTYTLDLGYGSGRDSKWFIQQGCRVTALGGSKALAGLASEYLGLEQAMH